MSTYDHKKIEKKWQDSWTKKKVYKTENKSKKQKFYVLDMFPYPSGAGLHVGHPKGYIGSDVFARMKRMQGFNVLHPMGYDAFGLPAEQYAIEHNINPRQAVEKNVKTFEKQLSIMGLSYDWDRRVNTTDPNFYKWTQWIFLKIYNSWYNKKTNKALPIEKLIKIFNKNGNKDVDAFCDKNVEIFGAKEWKEKSKKEKQDILMKYRLAYEGYAEVNWCPGLGTVLANDEVVDGKDGLVSERGGFPVEKKSMRQWFMRITAYADRLLSGLDGLNWSTHIKEIQKNWIGKSEGINIDYHVIDSDLVITCFTTTPVNFGASFLVISPEHPLVSKLTKAECKENVEKYLKETKNKLTDSEKKEKTGAFTGSYVLNHVTGEKIPVWVADFVLMGFGTGAVQGCPAHDERDFEFAKKYNLPIKQVVMPVFTDANNPHRVDKKHTNRNIVQVILKNHKNEVLIQFLKDKKWGNLEPKTFIIGGVEEGEDSLVAAEREIKEETGYLNIKFVEELPLEFQSNFFAAHKDVNRTVHVKTFVFDLLNEEKTDIMEDEYFTKDSHEARWIPFDEVEKTVHTEDQKFTWRFYRSGGFALTDGGVMINSDFLNNVSFSEAMEKTKDYFEEKGWGRRVVNYKMRDAIFARQRYWGEPIPLMHNKEGIITELPEKKLPLKLPPVKSYKPTGTGDSPLASVKDWVKAGYETNTMPGWAGSSWYFLRYMDPKNKKVFADKNNIKYWKNVDMYVGGQEHATGHLLYSRFWHKFLKDYSLVTTEEPFQTLRNQGMILGTDNRKMSKRWGNVINPDDVVKTHGADTLRLYEMFMGPFESSLPWSTDNIVGSRRFLERIWKISLKLNERQKNLTDGRFRPQGGGMSENSSVARLLHKTIKKVTEDIESFSFNTSVSSMMILLNEIEKSLEVNRKDFELFLKILSPFAPHITEEIWSLFGHKTFLVLEKWPTYDPKLIKDEEFKIALQINGKVRAEIFVGVDESEEDIKKKVLENEVVKRHMDGKDLKKFIYIKNRLVNIVV
jgi:leucyl-tRNA synthetase